MRITEDGVHEAVFICLTPKEAEELSEQLINHVGEKKKPSKVIEKLTNLMADLFYEEEKK